MRALVLGGAGFMGRHICDRLLTAGHHVTIFDRVRRPNVHSIVGDFFDADQLIAALQGIDWVFHLVWTTLPRSSNEKPRLDVKHNLTGSLGLLDACLRAGVRKIVFASSGGTMYGVGTAERFAEDTPQLPICSYGITKLAVEKYLHMYWHMYGLRYAVLRVSNPYGEGQRILGEQGAVAVFLGRIARGEPITIFGDGEAVRDYVYIKDVADAFLRAAELDDPTHHVFNIGSGLGVNLNQLLEVMHRVTGQEPLVRYAPHRSVDVPRSVLDITRARERLGWYPRTPLRDGLERTWSWVQHLAGSRLAVAAAA